MHLDLVELFSNLVVVNSNFAIANYYCFAVDSNSIDYLTNYSANYSIDSNYLIDYLNWIYFDYFANSNYYFDYPNYLYPYFLIYPEDIQILLKYMDLHSYLRMFVNL